MRRRESTFGPGRWAVERDRFQLDSARPAPTFDRTCKASALVPAILKDFGLEEKLWQHALASEWPQLVGEQVASRTRPGAIQNRVLNIFVSSPVWLSELTRTSRPLLLKNLQARFGAQLIRDIRLQPDPDRQKGSTPTQQT